MQTQIHATAVVEDGAKLGEGVRIGPFSHVGPNVELGEGVVIHSNAVVQGHTRLGVGVEVFSGAAVGLVPQDLKYDGSPTRLEVGDRTVLREHTSIHIGSTGPNVEGVTRIGSDCLIMAYTHVAHDCVVGDHVILANATQLAGHVTIESNVILGGLTNVHQFCRVGSRAFTGGATRVVQDIPPFCTADGHPARLYGLNTVGLNRAGFSAESIRALKRAYRSIFLRGPYQEAISAIESDLAKEFAEVGQLCEFLRSSERGVTRAPARRGNDRGPE